MSKYEYPSILCEYCICTDYGHFPVGTNQYNMCEGRNCDSALDNYLEDNPDVDENVDIEDFF
jgi:hypothetical protein